MDWDLVVEFHHVFDLMLNLIKTATPNRNETVQNGLAKVKSVVWWRFLDAFRKEGVAKPVP